MTAVACTTEQLIVLRLRRHVSYLSGQPRQGGYRNNQSFAAGDDLTEVDPDFGDISIQTATWAN